MSLKFTLPTLSHSDRNTTLEWSLPTSNSSGASTTWDNITGKPSTFTPSAHTHPLSEIEASGASSGQIAYYNGTNWIPYTLTSGGTVTSVAFNLGATLSSIFSFSGSPITTSGTITLSASSQNQNLVYASPNGSSGTPVFRSLVANDIPTLNYISTSLGTSLNSIYTVTSNTLDINSQTANRIYAGPTSGGAAIPTFRALVSADIPNLDTSKITTGLTNNSIVFWNSGLSQDASNFTYSGGVLTIAGYASNKWQRNATNYIDMSSGSATSIVAAGSNIIQCSGANGVSITNQSGTTYSFFSNQRTFINNSTPYLTTGTLGGSLTSKQSADFSFSSGEVTTTANATTTINAASGTFSTSGGVKSIGIGDKISLSSAASTYSVVSSIASTTQLTVLSNLGNGTTQTVNVKPAIFRLFRNDNSLTFIINSDMHVGLHGVINPVAILQIPSSSTEAQIRLEGNSANPSTLGNGDIWFLTTNNRLMVYSGAAKEVPLSDLTTGAAGAAAGTIRITLNGTDYNLLHT